MIFNIRKKTLFVIRNTKPATRNPQRVAFTMEPLSGASQSLVLRAKIFYLPDWFCFAMTFLYLLSIRNQHR